MGFVQVENEEVCFKLNKNNVLHLSNDFEAVHAHTYKNMGGGGIK